MFFDIFHLDMTLCGWRDIISQLLTPWRMTECKKQGVRSGVTSHNRLNSRNPKGFTRSVNARGWCSGTAVTQEQRKRRLNFLTEGWGEPRSSERANPSGPARVKRKPWKSVDLWAIAAPASGQHQGPWHLLRHVNTAAGVLFGGETERWIGENSTSLGHVARAPRHTGVLWAVFIINLFPPSSRCIALCFIAHWVASLRHLCLLNAFADVFSGG